MALALRVVVTRPEHEAPGWVAKLRERGFDALALPLISILPAPHPEEVRLARLSLASRRAVMFVSGNAVRHFFGLRERQVAWPDGVRAWGTGPGTRQALIDEGVEASLVDAPAADSGQFDSEALWERVQEQVRPGDDVLIVRGADANGTGRDWLASRLAGAGAKVDSVSAYARGVPAWTAAQCNAAAALACEAWLFSSSQAIVNLQALLPRQDWSRAFAAATHARIAQAARDAGFGVVCESRPEIDAVGAALESFR